MGRISVIGNVGSGNTTVARALAAQLQLPYVELDALHWGPRVATDAITQLRSDGSSATTTYDAYLVLQRDSWKRWFTARR